jgi:hypothetical protein
MGSTGVTPRTAGEPNVGRWTTSAFDRGHAEDSRGAECRSVDDIGGLACAASVSCAIKADGWLLGVRATNFRAEWASSALRSKPEA